MTDLSLQLSAYLDGELDPAESDAVEERLASDPAAQAEFDALMAAQAAAQEQFDAQLTHPVPLALVQQIKSAPLTPKPAPVPRRPVWATLAASLVVFAIGGAGGFILKDHLAPAQTGGWLQAIADYHAVYATQTRHLVEVGADEADHLQAWLGKTVGTTFAIPDLSGFGLTFEGGRLLVANGKPVAQLMYLHADGTVIALCFQRSASVPDDPGAFKERTINGFDFVSWNADGTNYVVIGPTGQPGLNAIAERAAVEI